MLHSDLSQQLDLHYNGNWNIDIHEAAVHLCVKLIVNVLFLLRYCPSEAALHLCVQLIVNVLFLLQSCQSGQPTDHCNRCQKK